MFTPILLALALTPQQAPTPDDTIHAYLTAQSKKLSTRFLDGAKTKEEWEAKRPKLKEQLLEMLGLWPLPDKSPLKATTTGTLDKGEVVIEKLHFQSKPGLYVTANLYRPKTITKKLPAVLYVCGHSGRGRDGNKTAFQDHGLWFASNGYICIIVDTLQLGEIAAKHHGTYNLNRFWWQDRGYTPAGVECWNGIRAIDYLCSRDDVDAERIGVTGISGGGATTVWIAATDDRVKVAVPVSGMSDLESYVNNKVINGHCDCMFAINTYQWEWTTILALFAPKPLLFANSDNDPIFPMDGNRRIIGRLRSCYTMLGAKDNVEEYVSKGNHDYRPDLRVAIFSFFNKHLSQTKNAVKDADFPKVDGKDLRVFPDELPNDALNDAIDETFVRMAKPQLPFDAATTGARRTEVVKNLRAKSFRTFPDIPALAKGDPFKGLEMDVEGEAGVPLECAFLLATKPGFNNRRRTFVILNTDEKPLKQLDYWKETCDGDDFVYGLTPRGHGPHRWTQKNPPNTVERSLALLGQTADTGRVYDVASVLAHVAKTKKADERIRLVGHGQAGIIAAYATLFTPNVVSEIIIVDPPTSHRTGPHFLNVLRVTDIPEVLGLLAPEVKLTLINGKDKAFDTTAAYYKAAGKEDQLERR